MTRKIIIALVFLFTACSNNTSQPQSTATQPTKTDSPANTAVPGLTDALKPPSGTATPQLPPAPITYGPDKFPEGYNPLTAQRVTDTSLLDIPALLVSISH